MSGKIIFTNKDHLCASDRVFETLPSHYVQRLEISEEYVNGFYGFGVAITPSSCYELSLMNSEERKKLLNHLYSKNGMGLSVGRICIGSSDYSPEVYSYDDVAFDTSLEHFSVKRDEEYIIPIIKEILAINPNIYLFASPWSPPYWMKTGGEMCGGYMREQYLDCYADYIVKFIKAYAEYGIKISAITPQNEPDTAANGFMPACIWHPETEAKFIGILKEKFKKSDLNVKIWMFDHNFSDTQRVVWSLENCDGLKELCDGVAFHYYSGTIEQTSRLRKGFPDIELHFTEGGPRLFDNYEVDWCKWGLMISKAIKVGYRSFTGWNLMLNELGGPNVGPHIGKCGGFITLDNRTDELVYSGQYKSYSHIAPYISPESTLRYISVDETFDLPIHKYPGQDKKIEGILIENPNGQTVAVLINPNGNGKQIQIEINGKLWYAELHADSISTLII